VQTQVVRAPGVCERAAPVPYFFHVFPGAELTKLPRVPRRGQGLLLPKFRLIVKKKSVGLS
jgi:hypothetical protein